MKRPKPNEKVREDNFCIDTLNYMEDMELYCNYLEHVIKINSHRHYVLAKRSRKRMRKLEIKLKKAIELLARNDILQMNEESDWEEWFDRLVKEERDEVI